MPLEVFQAPVTLREQLIEFQAKQLCHPFTKLEQHLPEFCTQKLKAAHTSFLAKIYKVVFLSSQSHCPLHIP